VRNDVKIFEIGSENNFTGVSLYQSFEHVRIKVNAFLNFECLILNF
jgi:hypothetical protein